MLSEKHREDEDWHDEESRRGRDRRPILPPSPIMKGMKGGIVCASPEVSNTAKAYSFQAKIMQKMAVAAMPVVACGSTTLRNACSRE